MTKRSDIDKAIDRIENMVVSVYAPGNRDHIRHMFKRHTVKKILEELVQVEKPPSKLWNRLRIKGF